MNSSISTRYAIVSIVGAGGMGTVALAHDKKLKRSVAVKLMSPQLAQDSSFVARFVREARACAHVQHRNCVQVFDVETNAARPFIVMEYVQGPSLQQLVEQHGPLSFASVLEVAIQCAEGLHAIHSKGIVHRDLKPSNILIETKTRTIKITDFGLAQFADTTVLTHTGELLGTPSYMSPEQARGLELDIRSDLFSLGGVLYFAVSARQPFEAGGAYATINRVINDHPTRLTDFAGSTIPDWFVALIYKLMEKNRDARFRSAKQLLRYLRQGALHTKYPTRHAAPLALKKRSDSVVPTANSGKSPLTHPLNAFVFFLMLLTASANVILFIFSVLGSTEKPMPQPPKIRNLQATDGTKVIIVAEERRN